MKKISLLMFLLMTYVASALDVSCSTLNKMEFFEKEYCIVELPVQYKNETFKCYTTVEYEGEVLQVNPEYNKKSDSYISVHSLQETDQFFPEVNNMVNVYFSGKNLQPEYNYTLGVICSSEQRILKEEKEIFIDYNDMEHVFSRAEWLKDNTQYVITATIFFIILGAGGVSLWQVAL